MATIAEQLTSLANTKTAIKEAIVAKGVAVADTDTFASYATKIGEIQSGGGGEVVDKTKFGVSIDNIFGNVDENGTYVTPTEPFGVDLAGLKKVGADAFAYAFYRVPKLLFIRANNIVSVSEKSFYYAFFGRAASGERVIISFEALEEINSNEVFYYAFGLRGIEAVSFKKLKKVIGTSVFDNSFYGTMTADKIFPALEEIGGNKCFSDFMTHNVSKPTTFSKVKKLTGSTSQYSSIFHSYVTAAPYLFPRATEVTGYVFYTNVKEIHFAAQNQVAIEACSGYENKWGAKNATIFFDLMLTITVSGFEYSREHTIDGYTSWKDSVGNMIYTDATTEPTVGTIVYSDQGTTQVGIVEAVA